MVEGIGPSYQWLPKGDWETIFDFLRERFPNVEAEAWLSRMAKGEVVDEKGLRLNGQTFVKNLFPNTRFAARQRIRTASFLGTTRVKSKGERT